MRILIASPIYPDTVDELRRFHEVTRAFDVPEEDLKEIIKECDALIFRSGVNISAELIDAAPNLRLLLRAGAGSDNLDLESVQRRGIEFVRIPEPGAQAVAELAFALMLALARQLVPADRLSRQGHWAKHQLDGYLLSGKTLGIVGAGNIGSRVGQMGAAWGMDVVGCVEHSSPLAAEPLRERGIRLAGLEEVVEVADFLTIHVPLKESTRNLIDARMLSRMKARSFLVNLSRGGVVNEQALYDALRKESGLAGAGLDVHANEGEGHISPLAALTNVVLTPHIGATTIDSQRAIGRRIVEIVNDHWTREDDLMVTSDEVMKGVIVDAESARVEVSPGVEPTGADARLGKKTAQLRSLLNSSRVELLMEAHSGLSARIVEEAGFKGIWGSGLCMSAALGVRDNNEASWTQVLEIAEFMADATTIPILLDADTGYGNFNSVRRLVRKLEQRGVAGVCIEDKLFPKSNSFIGGETPESLISTSEFVGKIKAAKDTQLDADFCVVARVESLVLGLSVAEALERANAYADAGADAILIHSRSDGPEEVVAFMNEWRQPCPVVVVPTTYYRAPPHLFEQVGVSVVIWANHLLRSSVAAMERTAAQILEERSPVTAEGEIASLKEVFRLQDVDELTSAEHKYLPGYDF